jgi:ADP-ribose pyrophosphatase YjhB (NUDIX family)
VAISPHVARLRGFVGHDLLHLPSVSVLPLDGNGRLLLVKHAGGRWGLVGGAIDPGESPVEAAVRESREEIGVEVQVRRLLDVVGGPDFEVTYANGDRVAYVSVAYEAEIVDGTLRPDGDEVAATGWFRRDELAGLALNPFARALLAAVGYLGRT